MDAAPAPGGLVDAELWTRLSIGVLVFGAPLVFAWFLGDAIRLLRGVGGDDDGTERDARGPEGRPRG